MAISDRYEDLELIQPTPTGDIYRAKHSVLGRPVLVRTIKKDAFSENAVTEIVKAIKTTATLVHPNVLSVVDGELDGDIYYVTDNVVGALRDRMDEAPFPAGTAARWGLQLLRGIQHAHAHGVIHRGISPWRVYFDQAGTVMLADFGLSTALKDESTGMVTLEADATAYLPMKVLRDPSSYSETADRYGVAALLAEIITGSVPEIAEFDPSGANGEVPEDVVDALTTLLRPNASADAVDVAIAAFKAWVDSESDPDEASSPAPKKSGGKRTAKSRKSDAKEEASAEAAEDAEEGDEAERAAEKLNKYADLFAD